MRKIKIISTPYKKEIKYQDWNEHTSVWDDIIAETHPHVMRGILQLYN